MFRQTYFSTAHHIASSIRTLAAMLLLLAAIPTATSTNVPPPLPEHEWVGKSSYNYTALHAHYAEVLVCLYIPVGVFGFYYWFVYVLIILYSLFNAISTVDKNEEPDEAQRTTNEKQDPSDIQNTIDKNQECVLTLGTNRKKKYHILGIFVGILAVIWSIFGLYQNIQTVRDCSHMTGFGAIRGVIYLTLVGSGFSAAGGILMVFQSLINQKKVAAVLYGVSLLFHWIAGPVYFVRVVISAGVTRIIEQWDKVRVGAMIVALLPFIVAHLGQWIMALSGKFFLCLYMGVISLTFLFCGAGNVILGKIIGDPWGGYFLRHWVGKVSAGFTAGMPVLEGLIFAGFGG
ncbi:hypothetical protein K440DRAFT_679036 [Wilcoxina mikolae CBS 423.85]|nr:hypothetical protein K440DRAFT_679036 [Wilcoxina mikolae CBS 423.85]